MKKAVIFIGMFFFGLMTFVLLLNINLVSAFVFSLLLARIAFILFNSYRKSEGNKRRE